MEKEFEPRQAFFKFKSAPFSAAPSPIFYDAISSQVDALDKLNWAIHESKGILLLSGGGGTGKTTLLIEIERAHQTKTRCAFLKHPPTDPLSLMENLLLAFKIPIQQRKPTSFAEMLKELQNLVIESASLKQRVIVLIDNAHLLSKRSLEFIRLFSNLMTERQRLLTVILAGRSPLIDTVNSEDMRQFSQRVFVGVTLGGLELRQVEGYLKFHLAKAGGGNEVRFEPGAFSPLHKLTQGNPRMLCILAEGALKIADRQKARLVSVAFVTAAAKEMVTNTDN